MASYWAAIEIPLHLMALHLLLKVGSYCDPSIFHGAA
jgi:hypothetical protein